MAALSHSPTHPKPRPHPHNRRIVFIEIFRAVIFIPQAGRAGAERGAGAVRAAIVEGLRRQRLRFYYR